MEKFEWTDEFSVNNDIIDYEHQGLLSIYSEMVEVFQNGGDNLRMTILLTDLADYAMTHFKTEEAYMESISYPKLEEHKELHSKYSNQVLKFTLSYLNKNPDNSRAVLMFIKNWWTDHILRVDREYAIHAAKYQNRSKEP